WVFDIVFCSDEGREAQSDRGFENSYRQQGECVVRKDPPEIKHPYIFSVSQAQTFELCPRKWAYQKMMVFRILGMKHRSLVGRCMRSLRSIWRRAPPSARTERGRLRCLGCPTFRPPCIQG